MGRCVVGFAPHRHWRTMTFLAALCHDRLSAPCVSDGPINGACFLTYVEQQFVRTLKPGDIVIVDNLGNHKSKAVRNAIKDAGATFLFPAALQSRSQSPRTGLRQDQTLDAHGPETKHGRRMTPSRTAHRNFLKRFGIYLNRGIPIWWEL